MKKQYQFVDAGTIVTCCVFGAIFAAFLILGEGYAGLPVAALLFIFPVTQFYVIDDKKIVKRVLLFYKKELFWFDVKEIGPAYTGAAFVYLSKEVTGADQRERSQRHEFSLALTQKLFRIIRACFHGTFVEEEKIIESALASSNVSVKCDYKIDKKKTAIQLYTGSSVYANTPKILFLTAIIDKNGIWVKRSAKLLQFFPWFDCKEIYLINSAVNGREKSLVCATRMLSADELETTASLVMHSDCAILPYSEKIHQSVKQFWKKPFIYKTTYAGILQEIKLRRGSL